MIDNQYHLLLRAHDRLRYQKHDIVLGKFAQECLEREQRVILYVYQSLLTDAKISQVSSIRACTLCQIRRPDYSPCLWLSSVEVWAP
jgi:hypothetical protein